MLSVFIPSSQKCISRRRYLLLFFLAHVLSFIFIAVSVKLHFTLLVIIFTVMLHYLVINMNCQRLRDSGFTYIKYYVWGTLAVYLVAIVLMLAEKFACDGFGTPLFLIWYFTTFSFLLLAPTETNLSNK
ncbi:hypothetical protein ETB55_17990 [Salmonella enterica subsp. enterica serovar Omuna]|nr:hypothetical protein [Salmonella enterica subsp. enterica serovar Omuna]